MAKTFKLTVSDRTALARSKRLREAGASVYVTGSTTIAGKTVSASGLTTVTTTGSGNAVTDGSVSSDGKAVVLRKGATFLTESGAGDMFLRKDQDDSTDYVLGMDAAQVGTSLSVGGSTTLGGTLEVSAGCTFHDDLTVEGLTRLADTYITGSIGTPQFADGFDGYGWRLWNRGTDGDDHHLTVDSLTVRRTMTVYELLIQKIRAIGGQFIISAANGTIATVDTFTDDTGLLVYAITLEDTNEFVAHDLMRCQTFTGEALKSYWVEIDSVAGDTIFVPVAEFGLRDIPEVGDEVVLCGNTTDTSRQSVIILSATEDGLPRIDLHDGVNSKAFSFVAEGETLGTLRVRTGKLDDITDDWFPTDRQPSGYGLYGGNAYLRGTFVLADSGEDVSTLFQVIQGNITALITANEQANYLSNSTFATDTDKWAVSGGTIVYDSVAGRNVLALQGTATQSNSDYNLHPTFDDDGEGLSIPRDFTLSFYGRTPDGAALNIYFEGEDTSGFEDYTPLGHDTRGAFLTYALTADEQYYEIAFRWDGTGDLCFRQVMTGLSGGCTAYLRDVRLVADNVTYFTTLFSQTVGSISALATRIDNLPDQIYNTIAGLYVSVDYFNSEISNYVTSSALQTELSKYVTIDGFSALFASEWDSEGEGGDMHSALIAAFVGKYEEEYSYIDPDTGEEKTVTVPTVESGIMLTADRILLEGYVSVNGGFSIDEAGNMTAVDGTFTGKITSTEGTIGGFTIGDTTIAAIAAQSASTSSLILSATEPSITLNHVTGDIDRTLSLTMALISYKDASRATPYGTEYVNWFVGEASATSSLYGAQNVQVHNDTYSEGNVGIALEVDGFISGADANALYGNHALYISKGDICGFRLRTRRFVNEDAYLSSMDSIAVIRCDSPQNVYLPEDAEDGQVIIVKHLGVRDGYIIVYAQGQDRISTETYSTTPSNATGQIRSGQWRIFFYDSANNLWHMGLTSE